MMACGICCIAWRNEMQITQYVWDVVDSNSWLITENNHGLLIDAVDNPELFETIQSLESLTIILTHCHFDHICGLNRIRKIRPDAKVIATELCSEYIGNKYRNMSSSADAFLAFYQQGKKRDTHINPFVCSTANICFEKELSLEWQGRQMLLYAVHGHSADGLVLNVNGKQLFSGDTLLETPTVTRLPGGNTRRFWREDIPLIISMKTETVFPGHGNKRNTAEMLQNAVDLGNNV